MDLRAEAVGGGEDEFGVKYRAAAEVSSLARDAHQPGEFPRNGVLAPDDPRLSPGKCAPAARNVRHCNKRYFPLRVYGRAQLKWPLFNLAPLK